MSKRLTRGHLTLLKENYEKACNAWLCELLNMWELDAKDGFWVGGEVGNVYCHDAGLSLDMSDIIFCVEQSVTIDKYFEYVDYIEKCHEYNFETPNLKSYTKGCPIVPKETFDKLDGIKKNLDDAIEQAKNNY